MLCVSYAAAPFVDSIAAEGHTAGFAGTPDERILAVFDAFTDEVLSEACRGCPFLMVLAEFPDPQNAAHC